MIKLFSAIDTTFASNGDIVLEPLKAKVHKKDNSDYYLELETSLDYVDYIIEGNIVVANTPTGDQAFRISNVQKTKSKISCKCWHVFYDSKNYLIASATVTDKTCNEALDILNNATEPQSSFETSSDILTISSYDCVRQSLYNAIQDIVSIYGGHLVRDNFSISVNESIGQDKGIIVQYKKNLKEITVSENWDGVVTKLLPTGKDGVMLNAIDPSADIYVESATQYDIPYTKTVTFSQSINEEDYPTEADYLQALVDDLEAQATTYVNANCLPKVNYTLKANLDRVSDIGDTIEVIDERLDVDLMTKVIGFVYDCLTETYSEVEFGNFAPSLSGLVQNTVSTAVKMANVESEEIKDQIIGIMSNSYVTYNGEKITVFNSLPKEDATRNSTIDQSGIKFNNGGLQIAKWDINGDLYLNNTKVDDFVSEHGTTDGWEWTKTKNGNVEAWKTIPINSFSWSSFGTYYKGEVDVTYPFNISDAVITATVNDCTSVGWVAKAKAVDNTKMHLQVVSNTNNDTMTVHIHVKA
jgi:phage minor structural protein